MSPPAGREGGKVGGARESQGSAIGRLKPRASASDPVLRYTHPSHPFRPSRLSHASPIPSVPPHSAPSIESPAPNTHALTVCEHIEANELRLQVDSQVAHPLETEEEERRDAGRPADDGEHPYGGGTEQPGRAVEQPRVALGAVDRAGEQGGREGAPDAAGAVDGKGIEGVVHLEDDQDQPRRAQVDERAHHAHHQGELRWDAGAAGSDRDQAAQDAVAGL
mmetsp:Transcript_24510/g.77011  ORF Transcript_24510/g.77011 Transcript_24510/m.77011 type:complete len:221 (+) Transcript_24510:870-1532(+)|eukprot:scaffold5372_cov114-Isochrysis_galbana.AAC.8